MPSATKPRGGAVPAAKKPYESPRLERLAAPTLERAPAATIGKHPMFDVHVAAAFDEPYDVRRLMKDHGSPLFLVSEKALRAQYRSFRDTFTAPGVDTRIAYSYKTNYLPAACAILHEEGALAEVVSGMEYQLARSLGVPGANIVFNGPFKRREEMETAVAEGALVNIDGFEELDALEHVAAGMGATARVGVRVNFRSGEAAWTKFGFNYESGDGQRALERIAAGKRLRLEALHNHSGTYQLDPRVYARACAMLLHLAERARKLGLEPTTIDLGGGFPSANRLKPAFDLPGLRPVQSGHLAPFAEAVLKPLSRSKAAFGERPILMLEPGRALVDTAVRLATTVVATKEFTGQEAAVVVDAGVNVLPTAYWYNHEIEPAAGRERKARVGEGARPTTVYGPLCMQIDVVRDQALLPPLEIGDVLLIANVGAYCMTQSMQFIQPRPAVVLLGPKGPEVARRRETWRDVFALDLVPERLRGPDQTF